MFEVLALDSLQSMFDIFIHSSIQLTSTINEIFYTSKFINCIVVTGCIDRWHYNLVS